MTVAANVGDALHEPETRAARAPARFVEEVGQVLGLDRRPRVAEERRELADQAGEDRELRVEPVRGLLQRPALLHLREALLLADQAQEVAEDLDGRRARRPRRAAGRSA